MPTFTAPTPPTTDEESSPSSSEPPLLSDGMPSYTTSTAYTYTALHNILLFFIVISYPPLILYYRFLHRCGREKDCRGRTSTIIGIFLVFFLMISHCAAVFVYYIRFWRTSGRARLVIWVVWFAWAIGLPAFAFGT